MRWDLAVSPGLDQCSGEGHTAPAGVVVVAGSPGSERLVTLPPAESLSHANSTANSPTGVTSHNRPHRHPYATLDAIPEGEIGCTPLWRPKRGLEVAPYRRLGDRPRKPPFCGSFFGQDASFHSVRPGVALAAKLTSRQGDDW